MNRYLRDRANRRGMPQRDGRNPYGSRGGYVSSSRRGRDRADMNYDNYRGGDNRMRDREMDMEYDYAKYNSRYDSRYNPDRRSQDGHYPYQQYGERNRPMEYEMYGYGIGGIRPMDYGYDYNYDYARGGSRSGRDRNYNYDYGYDYASEDMEKEWGEHLKKWREELKRYDRFNMPKDQVIQNAKQMGVEFDKYNEEEFLTTYYMVMSDYPTIANEPHTYISLAKDWLEDEDSKLKGSDKLCAYYYEVIKGGEED